MPLILFGVPAMRAETTRFAVAVPHLGSLILTHTWDGEIPGLKALPPQDRPNSTIVFWTFRIMVGLGMLMLLLGVWAVWARLRRQLYTSKLLLSFAILMVPPCLIPILPGRFTPKTGRH